MGSGASAPKEVCCPETEASETTPSDEKEAKQVDGDDNDEECGDTSIEFPALEFRRFLKRRVSREELLTALGTWATQKCHEDEKPSYVWRLDEAFAFLQCYHGDKLSVFKEGLQCVSEVLQVDDAFEVLKSVLRNCQTKEQCDAVLTFLPEDSLATITDGQWLCGVGQSFPALFSLKEKAWQVEFWDKELYPRGKSAVLEYINESYEDTKISLPLFEALDGLNGLGLAQRLLALGASAHGLLDTKLEEEILTLAADVDMLGEKWTAHHKLCCAIALGEAGKVSQSLSNGADPNWIESDGDAYSVSPLVLAMLKEWKQKWLNDLINIQLKYNQYRLINKSSLEVVKALLSSATIDPNIGAYQYGWHGSHVRISALGVALAGCAEIGDYLGDFERSHYHLIFGRRDIMRLLIEDPRTDLEEVYFEQFEGFCKPRTFGALSFCTRDVRPGQVDFFSVRLLLRAGALMSGSIVKFLAQLEDILRDLEMGLKDDKLTLQLEGSEADPSEDVDQQDGGELEEHDINEDGEDRDGDDDDPFVKNSDGTFSKGGYVFKEGQFEPMPLSAKVALKEEQIKDLKDLMEWHNTVKCGSNVFKSASLFPEAFCRVAATIERGLRKILGKLAVFTILDFLPFFDFNRRRRLPSVSWHRRITRFGRPLPELLFRVQELAQKVQTRMEQVQDPDQQEEDEQQLLDSSSLKPESCWVEEWEEDGDED